MLLSPAASPAPQQGVPRSAFGLSIDHCGSHDGSARGLTQPESPEGLSCTSTRTGSCSALQVTPEEAASICQSLVQDIDRDMAAMTVTSRTHGSICGLLQWGTIAGEEVELELLQIKPGYVVVGEVIKGPDLFRKLAWKMKSVNGDSNVPPTAIAKGDRVVLESPRWAMERLGLGPEWLSTPEPAAASKATAPVAPSASAGAAQASAGPKPARTPTKEARPLVAVAPVYQSPGPGFPDSPLTDLGSVTRAASESSSPAPGGRSVGRAVEGGLMLEFDLVPARPTFVHPVVPKIDIVGSQQRQRRRGRGPVPVANVVACYEDCAPPPNLLMDEEGRCQPMGGFLQCGSLWRCI